ncbi:MAG: ABC transporter ATP-binding protein [Bacillota bacterium]
MLRLENLSVFYGKIQALKGITLEVGQGELVALIGANGAGKTTTLRAISGVLKPAGGAIFYNGKRIDKLEPATILQLGICQVPEGRELFGEMTVLENLEMGALYIDNKKFKEKLEEVFGFFPILKDRKNQLAKTLSGGEQQMLAISRGLMSDPNCLLLDEPSLGLAPLIVEQLAQIISDLHRKGLTILLVEQNAVLALELANRGYVLETGCIVLEGTGQELLSNELVKKAYLGI